MADAKIEHVGVGRLPNANSESLKGRFSRVPKGFLIVVALPTVVALLYFFMLSAPRYVSESRFVVRAPDKPQLSGAAIALQGVGIPSAQTDAFIVHEYISSKDSIVDLKRAGLDVEAIVGRKEGDAFFRYPRIGEGRSAEGLHEALGRFSRVGYDARTGISTLKVQAFRPKDAVELNEALLQAGERLVNRLNERSAKDAVAAAEGAYTEAQEKLASVQALMTDLRNHEGFVDPVVAVTESAELIGTLRTQIAQLVAERDQLKREAPGSPLLASIEGRIQAYEQQVTAERRKLTGGPESLTPSLGRYQTLAAERELAERQLAQATAVLLSSRQDASRQKMYLERVVNPNTPQAATEPLRWRGVFVVFISALLIYFVGWLVWAGVREHRQD